MTSRSRKRYGFGPFELDAHDRLLTCKGEVVALTPKALDTLLILVESGGHVVTKDELIERVWPDSFVEQNNLAQNISALRKALGEQTDGPRYIDTVPKRGYRFVAPLVTLEDAAAETVAESSRDAAGMGRTTGAGPIASGIPITGSGASAAGVSGTGAAGAAAPGSATGATSAAVARLVRASSADQIPETHYARSGDVNIAYQVVGDGLFDLVFVMGWVSHLEYTWTEPTFARFLRRLASFSRLILFDKRGTGLSDRVTALPTLEQRMDDVRAVMEAVGSRRAALVGVSEGGPMCSLFAATYPEKTLALAMIGTYARRLWAPDYPWGPTLEERQAFHEEIQQHWGGPVGLEARAPSRLHDPQFRDWWATYIRMGASPGAALALTRMNADIDVRAVLPHVRVPTLILHRTGDRCLSLDEGRYVASRIPGARFCELPGDDHLPFVGDQDALLDQIEGFLTGFQRRDADRDRVLATVLCGIADPLINGLGYPTGPQPPVAAAADASAIWNTPAPVPAAPGDPAQRERLLAFATREIERFRGQLVRRDDGMGPDLMATFDGPARAIRCASMIAEAARRLGWPIRLGAHTGECEVGDDRLSGLAVDVAAQVAANAMAGEVVVSRTVRDLVAGSGLKFRERDYHVRPMGDDDLTLFCVESHHLSSALLHV
jgi:DNA-binding winged helix-turn-helix (wHTH) protein/pimeloyl-ACP methyl ester carboxylesterase